MSVRSRLAGLAGIGLLALAATFVGSAPAQAATGFDRCPEGWMCLFDDFDGQGAMYKFATGTPNLGDWKAEDKTRSIWNRTGSTVTVYSDRDYRGINWGLLAGDRFGSTGEFSGLSSLTVHDDKASGYDRCPQDWVCLFDGPNGTGTMYKFAVGSADLRDWSADDTVVSLRNRTGKEVLLYEDYNFEGVYYAYPAEDGRYNGYRLPVGVSSVKVG